MAILLLITVLLVGLVMVAMAVGVLLDGRCLRGSCGGPDIVGPDGESLLCATCPKRKELEAERRARADPVEQPVVKAPRAMR